MSVISHATAQGERPEQQDRYVIAEIAGPPEASLAKGGPPAGTLLAVMDGHGGTRTAEVLANHTAALFQLELKNFPSDLLQALKNTVQRLAQRTAIETSGSTLSAVFIPEKKERAFVAVLGDSPVLIHDAVGTLWISPMHNARTNSAERAAAAARGARFVNGYLEDPEAPGHGLQMSRALGDRALTRILHREPELFSVPLGKNSWIVVATDGVLDGADLDFEKQLRALAGKVEKGLSAQELVEDAVRRKTGDNVTLLHWKYA